MDIKFRVKEILKENDELKFSLAKTNGYIHSSHNIWYDRSGNQFKWTGTRFEPVKETNDQLMVKQVFAQWEKLKSYEDQKWYPVSVTINGKKMVFMTARKRADKVDRIYLKTIRSIRELSGTEPEKMWDYYEIERGQLKSSKKFAKKATEQEIKDFENLGM